MLFVAAPPPTNDEINVTLTTALDAVALWLGAGSGVAPEDFPVLLEFLTICQVDETSQLSELTMVSLAFVDASKHEKAVVAATEAVSRHGPSLFGDLQAKFGLYMAALAKVAKLRTHKSTASLDVLREQVNGFIGACGSCVHQVLDAARPILQSFLSDVFRQLKSDVSKLRMIAGGAPNGKHWYDHREPAEGIFECHARTLAKVDTNQMVTYFDVVQAGHVAAMKYVNQVCEVMECPTTSIMTDGNGWDNIVAAGKECLVKAANTRCEHMLCQTLSRKKSSKTKGRVLNFTTELSRSSGMNWETLIVEDLRDLAKEAIAS